MSKNYRIGKFYIGICKKHHIHIGTHGKGLDYCNETGKSYNLFWSSITRRKDFGWDES